MEHIEPALLWIAGICGSIATIAGLISLAVQPYKKLLLRVDDLEKMVLRNNEKLENDHASFQQQEVVNELMLRSMNNILLHELTGNHTEQMQECSKQIEAFIYKKSGSL